MTRLKNYATILSHSIHRLILWHSWHSNIYKCMIVRMIYSRAEVLHLKTCPCQLNANACMFSISLETTSTNSNNNKKSDTWTLSNASNIRKPFSQVNHKWLNAISFCIHPSIDRRHHTSKMSCSTINILGKMNPEVEKQCSLWMGFSNKLSD